MSKKLEECAKAKSQLKVTDLFSSAEGSESEGVNYQYKKVQRKRRREPTGDNSKHTPHQKNGPILKLCPLTQNQG